MRDTEMGLYIRVQTLDGKLVNKDILQTSHAELEQYLSSIGPAATRRTVHALVRWILESVKEVK